MTDFMNFITAISEQYGNATAALIASLVIIGMIIWGVIKNYSILMNTFIDYNKDKNYKEHRDSIEHRKLINSKVREVLILLAGKVGGDRALLFEYSNGTSNLIGLPFFYASASCEVVTPNTHPVSHLYQRISLSSLSDFIDKLEDKGYYYIADLELEKDDNLMLYTYMSPNGVRSAIFYTIEGLGSPVGFIVVTSVGQKCFTRDAALPEVAKAAQQISSILNFDDLHEGIENEEGKRKKFKFFRFKSR